MRIKVTVPKIVAYYDVEVSEGTSSTEIAATEERLFREGKIGWEDIIGGAQRTPVEFEGVNDE